jgi:hypothetical protein
MGFYRCPYILRSGIACNEGYYRPEGCKVHWKAPVRKPCKECGELTSSAYGACKKHSGKHRSREHYHQKKLAKMASMQAENLS